MREIKCPRDGNEPAYGLGVLHRLICRTEKDSVTVEEYFCTDCGKLFEVVS